ncbi:polypeptide N-acetylgalactosaminyltransferase [Gammaproteobacteria bacterium]
MKPRVSFVIPSRNENPSVVAATLEGLLATSQGFWREIIVIDDGSDIHPVSFSHPEVIVLRNPEPVGASRARRQGCQVSSGEVLVILDAHMSFGASWLEPLLVATETNSLVCSPWMDYTRTKTYCLGADFSWCAERNYAKRRNPGIGYRVRDRRPNDALIEIPMVIGACYALRRTVYHKLGSYNPNFEIYGCEEQDLSIRAWMAGFGVKLVTGAMVGYLDRGSGGTPYGVSRLFNGKKISCSSE